MDSIENLLRKADRLSTITQRVGFALWQIQELESCTAQYFVLLVQAQKGMGIAEGDALIEEAQAKTFGSTIRLITKARLMDPEIETRFISLLSERNWLVHRSRLGSRKAVHDDNAMGLLIARLDTLVNEATSLLKEVGARAEMFVRQHGVSAEHIDSMSQQILEQWQSA